MRTIFLSIAMLVLPSLASGADIPATVNLHVAVYDGKYLLWNADVSTIDGEAALVRKGNDVDFTKATSISTRPSTKQEQVFDGIKISVTPHAALSKAGELILETAVLVNHVLGFQVMELGGVHIDLPKTATFSMRQVTAKQWGTPQVISGSTSQYGLPKNFRVEITPTLADSADR